MSLDFGERVRRQGAPLDKLWIAAAAALVLVFPATWLLQWRETVPAARSWSPAGRPCPEIPAQAFQARRLQAPEAFGFRGVTFFHRFGHASCRMIRYGGGRGIGDYPVCQFTGPATLAVTADGQTSYYDLGVGQPATVSVRHGEVQCVMASHFSVAEGVPE
jgi:hypothetical protein